MRHAHSSLCQKAENTHCERTANACHIPAHSLIVPCHQQGRHYTRKHLSVRIATHLALTADTRMQSCRHLFKLRTRTRMHAAGTASRTPRHHNSQTPSGIR